MNDAKTKQQVIEKITSSTNILVTVSKNPSVDALSAAIALTLVLNKLEKHTTAIFSGQTPPAITFLDPARTFETSIDSLRDFIIALDKEKADHLRYKVEGDLVKIFITPYKTTLSNDDLQFSQGDYNVELVLALGVENQTHLDAALEAHGSILHDATVITIGNEQGSSSLGSIDWRDETASSLSEMLVTLTDALQSDKPVLDQQIATALLTGIVAETDRFSNTKTSSKVMTIAAQLMAAGADQQLIAAKLQESHEIGVQAAQDEMDARYTRPLAKSSKPLREGLAIDHDETIAPEQPPIPTVELAPEQPEVLATTPAPLPPDEVSTPVEAPVVSKIADAYALDPELDAAPAPAPQAPAPLLGGLPPIDTPQIPAVEAPLIPDAQLNAPPIEMTSPLSSGHDVIVPQATPSPEVPMSEEISKHSYVGSTNTFDSPVNGPVQTTSESVDIFAAPPTPPAVPVAPEQDKTRDETSRDDALAAANATFDQPVVPQAFSPAPGITLPPPPPLPDFGALPSTIAAPYVATDPSAVPERLGDILAPPPQPVSTDPGQFKIPGQ